MQPKAHNYYGEDGCCLTCEEPELRSNWNRKKGEGCLCTDCKCKKCKQYIPKKGKCEITEENEWKASYPNKIVCITKETEKAYKGKIKDQAGLTDFIWIPKKATKKIKEDEIRVQNWLLLKKDMIEMYDPLIKSKYIDIWLDENPIECPTYLNKRDQ